LDAGGRKNKLEFENALEFHRDVQPFKKHMNNRTIEQMNERTVEHLITFPYFCLLIPPP